jgi:hypothetical protein
LLYDRWLFLDGLAEADAKFGDRMFLVLGISTIVFAILWAIAFNNDRSNWLKTIFPWLLFVLFAWFLMSPLSIPVWQFVPLLQKVQFPYRVSMVLDLSVAATAVFALRSVCKTPRVPSLIGLGFCVILLGTMRIPAVTGPLSDSIRIAIPTWFNS